MRNIREVVHALGTREGVEAAILLGRDGLTIDSHVASGLDTDSVAALVPSVVDACTRLGAEGGRRGITTSVTEYANGLAIVAQITPEALLAILVRRGTNVGSLLYDLRRHRTAIAALL